MARDNKKEFWRWEETSWVNADVKWQDAEYITLGIDVGSVSSQAVIMCDGQIFAYGNMRTGQTALTVHLMP